ncbi:unnamed protein product, partial [Protopolystoma xenopodis]
MMHFVSVLVGDNSFANWNSRLSSGFNSLASAISNHSMHGHNMTDMSVSTPPTVSSTASPGSRSFGVRPSFSVASQHDALLTELFERGNPTTSSLIAHPQDNPNPLYPNFSGGSQPPRQKPHSEPTSQRSPGVQLRKSGLSPGHAEPNPGRYSGAGTSAAAAGRLSLPDSSPACPVSGVHSNFPKSLVSQEPFSGLPTGLLTHPPTGHFCPTLDYSGHPSPSQAANIQQSQHAQQQHQHAQPSCSPLMLHRSHQLIQLQSAVQPISPATSYAQFSPQMVNSGQLSSSQFKQQQQQQQQQLQLHLQIQLQQQLRQHLQHQHQQQQQQHQQQQHQLQAQAYRQHQELQQHKLQTIQAQLKSQQHALLGGVRASAGAGSSTGIAYPGATGTISSGVAAAQLSSSPYRCLASQAPQLGSPSCLSAHAGLPGVQAIAANQALTQIGASNAGQVQNIGGPSNSSL